MEGGGNKQLAREGKVARELCLGERDYSLGVLVENPLKVEKVGAASPRH